jgi:hypothetical protein
MLYTNMGRVVIYRATPYINRNIPLWDNVMNGELEAEWHLTMDIVHDPNSLAYFSDDTPIVNMLKRFKIQIELWKNVLNLRQGRLYSQGGYDSDDGITGLLRVLSQYDWTYFDSPDMAHYHDEGSVLRKLLAVFSLRPTVATFATVDPRVFMGVANYNPLLRNGSVKIPIINVRLPTHLQQNANVRLTLKDALSQADFFIEHKRLVPKHRSVFLTQDIVFFYVNRRVQAVNLTQLNINISYTTNPYQTLNVAQTTINDMPVQFEYNMNIGDLNLQLRSIVTVYRPPVSTNIVGGSSAIVIPKQVSPVVDPNRNFYYNPLLANYISEVNGQYKTNTPISRIKRNTNEPNRESIDNLGTKYGTIFMYAI